MIASKKFRRLSAPERQAPRPRVEGTVYAIGDVHGRLDLFERLIQQIRADASAFEHEERLPTVILLGDLIDRGPHSAGCIERAITLGGEGWCRLEVLQGNHEEAVLLFLEDHTVGPNWVRQGGEATLTSYGVEILQAGQGLGWLGVQAALRQALPASHHQFFLEMKLWLEHGDYLFVHAGVRPGLSIERQSQADLLWIRQAFLNAETPYPGKVVVHGHTPTREPELKRWRIGVDTGAYASGVLSAIRLRGYERAVLQAV